MTTMTMVRSRRRAVRTVDWENVFGWALLAAAVAVWTLNAVMFAAL